MKKTALFLAITAALSMTSTTWASEGYTGGKLTNGSVPAWQDGTTQATRTAQPDPEAIAAQKAAAANEQANKNKSKNKKQQGQETTAQENLPITLYGDHVIYHQDSGDFSAEGRVRVYQGTQQLYTGRAEGNMKSGDVYLKQGGTMVEGKTTTHGKWAHYNFNNKKGEIRQIEGNSDADFFRAEHATIHPDQIVMDKGGSTTRCPAVKHDPCLEIRADRVVMYPKDKIVAYNVKVYIKGKHIYSRDRWINRLDGKQENTIVPHIGQSKEHGMEITYTYEKALSDKDTVALDMVYYSKIGWRPMLHAKHDERNFAITYKNGHQEDSDNNWIKKQNDFTIAYKPHKFTKKLPLNYSLYYNHGLWSDNYKKSWHTEYGGYLSHDRLYWGDKYPLTLNMGVGHKWVKESYDEDANYKTLFYNVVVGKSYPAGWRNWVGYYWQKKEYALFDYDSPDMDKELQFGLAKNFDRNNRASVVARYDAGNSLIYEYIYRIEHDFCCWRITLEYKDKKYNNDSEWSINYELYRW